MTSPVEPHAAALRLPSPADDRAAAVFAALRKRRTTRDIAPRALSRQQLSNLLWAAGGVNRESGPFGQPGRTAASASNSQEILIFVALKQGIFRYEAAVHRLMPVVAGDFRHLGLTPHQGGVDARAPVQLIYVADLDRLIHTAGFQEPGLLDPEIQKSYYYVDTGLIAGNVYLYAAACGLAAWFHNCDRAALHQLLGLGSHQRVVFTQSVGHPRRK